MARLPNRKPAEIYCPECAGSFRGAVRLVVKTNRKTQEQFLGCPNYPQCEFTQEIPEATKMRLAGQKGLFD
jgi:ssDNA-binding Zn-finger/Zn-ribbon topoisomerase 1